MFSLPGITFTNCVPFLKFRGAEGPQLLEGIGPEVLFQKPVCLALPLVCRKSFMHYEGAFSISFQVMGVLAADFEGSNAAVSAL